MEKELNQLKVVLNIFQKFLELNKCSKAIFELDSYDLKMQNGNKFLCDYKWTNSPIPIDRIIEDFMDVLHGKQELDNIVYTPAGGESEVYNYSFFVIPENRMVEIYGDYSYYTGGDEEKNFYDTDELPEDIIGFLQHQVFCNYLLFLFYRLLLPNHYHQHLKNLLLTLRDPLL